MKKKSILLALGILGTLLLVTALVIAHGNQNQESMKGTRGMIAGMMEESIDEMHGGGMMSMMGEMMDSDEMKLMHQEMIAEMKEHMDKLEGDEKQEVQGMIKHMESCLMMN